MKKPRPKKRIGSPLNKVYVSESGHKGRGVFANRRIKSGEIVETSVYIKLPAKDAKRLENTVVNNYWFDVKNEVSALGLGYTSLYNHSKKPNAEFEIDSRNRTITIIALRVILAHEEIVTDYGYQPRR